MTQAVPRVICVALFSCLVAGLAPGQTQASGQTHSFEAADVHVSASRKNPYLRGPSIRDGRYEMRLATMLDLIHTAYGVEAERVLGGPSWLENDLFDVIAKPAGPTTVVAARPMLQALLKERFALAVHEDKRPVPAYALRAGRRPLLKKSEGEAPAECKFTPPEPPTPGGPPPGPPLLLYSCRNMTMAAFATALHDTLILGATYLNGRVAVDQTELPGAWDFDFKYTPRASNVPAGGESSVISLFDALDKQLGLRLDPVETPLPVIVVDGVNQKPTANEPDVLAKLHIRPDPTEFEVADLKPTNPGYVGMRFQVQPGGRVTAMGVPVKILIEEAWSLTDDELVGAPKWMDTDRYDLVAKADIGDRDMDEDQLVPMIRALLAERFKLVVHTEARPMNAYTLLALKPKMKKADPAERTKFREGPVIGAKDPRDTNPVLSRLVTCQNMTMAQFAEKLQSIAPGYIHSPVLDSTGLEGSYDFTLSFSPVNAVRGLPGGGRGGDGGPGAGQPGAPAASDPSGAVPLPDAIEKQLGLKLELQKRPVEVLVIDHVEQKPTGN